jgi:hypothetical protein
MPSYEPLPTEAASDSGEPAAEAPAAEVESGAMPQPTATPAGVQQPAEVPIIEERVVEMEWPERLRIGDSDVIRLALLPVEDGYVARAEFPEHALETKEVPVSRPDGYTLYALAQLSGVGFEISPAGEQQRYVPEGEEVAWRWTLAARSPGQHRLSIQLRLRWEPAPGTTGVTRESLAFDKGLDVPVTSFMGLSMAQAAALGWGGLLLGSGFLFAALFTRKQDIRGIKITPAGSDDVFKTALPNASLAVELPRELSLVEDESLLLRSLFKSYQRIVIENEFLSGYSGARTFLVRPIRADGCADAQTIVKLGPKESIRREFENYEAFVKDRLPPVTARIQRRPVAIPNKNPNGNALHLGQRAALQYTFIAEPGHSPVSLRTALLAKPDPDLLLRLFETFGPSWWMQRHPYTFRVEQEYDNLLPPHLVLEVVDGGRSGGAHFPIDEKTDGTQLNLAPGDLVRITAFHQVELRADGNSLTLTGIGREGRAPLRLRWLSSTPPADGVARVVATRMDLLKDWVASFPADGQLLDLPDPLTVLPRVLEETVRGTRSVIHGDLNLENALVGPGGLVWLIDFANTREGHPLYDFAHLESELVARVLAPQIASSRDYLDLWRSGEDPLLQALHAIAARCLFDPADVHEYDLALYMACLGALKYANLSIHAKHCLYLTASDLAVRLGR